MVGEGLLGEHQPLPVENVTSTGLLPIIRERLDISIVFLKQGLLGPHTVHLFQGRHDFLLARQ